MLNRRGLLHDCENRWIICSSKQDLSLKVFPLVDSSEQMVLLGSVPKRELLEAIEKQIGLDKRLAVKSARRRREEADRSKLNVDADLKINILEAELARVKASEGEGRPSRFAVSSVRDQRHLSTPPVSPTRSIKVGH